MINPNYIHSDPVTMPTPMIPRGDVSLGMTGRCGRPQAEYLVVHSGLLTEPDRNQNPSPLGAVWGLCEGQRPSRDSEST